MIITAVALLGLLAAEPPVPADRAGAYYHFSLGIQARLGETPDLALAIAELRLRRGDGVGTDLACAQYDARAERR